MATDNTRSHFRAAMRLLMLDEGGRFSLERFAKDDIPRYAILSHRWSDKADDEVTFEDVTGGKPFHEKPGYNKLKFCAEQIKKEKPELTYFWVDTCCIDKSNQSEFSTAIYSMYQWYERAEKCYVYLTDVSDEDGSEMAVQNSTWFSRGWTLQELLAPMSVTFFTKTGAKLGTKQSLKRQIAQRTGMPEEVLETKPLSYYSTNSTKVVEWTKQRKTKEEEDKAYCLLGLFDVSILLKYGEGEDDAFARLHDAINCRVPPNGKQTRSKSRSY
jgi:hypothetical protein